jgi:hypothetical protein
MSNNMQRYSKRFVKKKFQNIPQWQSRLQYPHKPTLFHTFMTIFPILDTLVTPPPPPQQSTDIQQTLCNDDIHKLQLASCLTCLCASSLPSKASKDFNQSINNDRFQNSNSMIITDKHHHIRTLHVHSYNNSIQFNSMLLF